jgi:hypothetical protein
MIEIHKGADGFYLHDPTDHLRFGPQDVYSTFTEANIAAITAGRYDRARSRTSSKTLTADQ